MQAKIIQIENRNMKGGDTASRKATAKTTIKRKHPIRKQIRGKVREYERK